jgi:hypothetical protein
VNEKNREIVRDISLPSVGVMVCMYFSEGTNYLKVLIYVDRMYERAFCFAYHCYLFS